MKDKPSYQDIQSALKDGSLESADLDTLWKCHRRIFELSSAFPPEQLYVTPQVEQTIQSLQHLIALKSSASDQQKAIRWAKIAGVSAIVAAVFGGVAIVPILYDWCRSSSQVLSPKTDRPASIQLPPPALVSPTNYSAPSTNSPKMP